MGVIYLALPLNDEIAGALSQLGIVYPTISSPPKGITPGQVFRVLGQISGSEFTVLDTDNTEKVRVDLQRSRESWTTLVMSKIIDRDTSCDLSFHNGDVELVREIVGRCAKECGPYVIWSDSGDIVEVVQ